MKSSIKVIAPKAFQLAQFIHPERDIAIAITLEALSALREHLRPQRKRAYYRLRGRIADGLSVKVRTKILLEESQKLQSLVYLYSERFERQQESALLSEHDSEPLGHLIGEEDWIIRFVKHSVATTVVLNSFYVTLSVSRTIFNYTTEEAAGIYDAIMQSESCSKDAPYFRKRRNEVLMKGLKERFGRVLQTQLVAHGEERFRQRPDSQSFFPLVIQCLQMFTPWDTECVLPETVNPMTKPIDELRFRDDDPEKEHPIEARRMHTLIHPNCFERLIVALGLDSPLQRLEVPMFCVKQSEKRVNKSGGTKGQGGNNSMDRRSLPPLSAEEWAELERGLAKEGKRRKLASPEVVSVMVDGVERATANLDHRLPIRLQLDERSRLIEIKGNDSKGELLLGSLLLDNRVILNATPSSDYRLKLAGSRELRLMLSPLRDRHGEVELIDIEVTFRRKVPLLGQNVGGAREQPRFAFQKPAWAFTTLVLLLAAIFGVVLLRRNTASPNHVAQVHPQPVPPSSSAPTPSTHDEVNSSQQPKGQSSPGRQSDQRLRPVITPNRKADEGVRALPAEVAMELSTVRKIYVEEGIDSPNSALRDTFINTINASGKLQTTDESSADVFLAWEVKTSGVTQEIEIHLSNRLGRKLLSLRRTKTKREDYPSLVVSITRELIYTITK